MLKMLEIRTANSGEPCINFEDQNEEQCYLFKSSGRKDCVRFGVKGRPMLLTQLQVRQLLPYLEQFSKQGNLNVIGLEKRIDE